MAMFSVGASLKSFIAWIQARLDQKGAIWISLLLLAVFSVKLTILLFSDFGNERLVLDEYTNLDYANSIRNSLSYVSGDGVAYRPPMYSVFLTVIKILVGNKVIYYKIANILLSLGTIYLVFASLADSRRILGAFFIAVFPPFFVLYELVLAENLAIFLCALLVKMYLVYREKGGFRNITALGFVAGLLALTRPESIPFLLVVHGVLIKRDRRMLVSLALLFGLIQIWMVRNYLILDRYPLFSTNAANTFYLATFPESTGTSIYGDDDIEPYPTFAADLKSMEKLNEIERYDYYSSKGIEYLRKNPSVFLRLLPMRILTLLAPESTIAARLIRADRYHLSEGLFTLFLALAWIWDFVLWISLVYLLVRRRIDWFYVAFLLGLIATVLFVIAESRYKMQIMPALVVGILTAKNRTLARNN